MANKIVMLLEQYSSIPEGAVYRGNGAFEYDDIKRLDPPQTKEKLLEKDEKDKVIYKKTGYIEDTTAVKPPKTKTIKVIK